MLRRRIAIGDGPTAGNNHVCGLGMAAFLLVQSWPLEGLVVCLLFPNWLCWRAGHVQTERLYYASRPKTFLQQWLRREPPKHELPLLMRAAHADAGA